MDAPENLQTQLLDIPDEDFDAVISAARAKCETKALRAGFPSHLADLASCIRVIRPKETTIISLDGGAYGSSFKVVERKVHLSVHLAQEGAEAIHKRLTLSLRNWRIYHIYISGGAGSKTCSMSIKYGDKRAPSKSAYSSAYDDPGQKRYETSHGGIKEVLEVLLKDLGSRASGLDEIEIIKLLVGDDVKDILDVEIEGVSLRKVIMEKKYNI